MLPVKGRNRQWIIAALILSFLIANELIQSVCISEQHYGLHVDRAYAGKFVASMEMAGFSLTLMHLNSERLECLGSTTSSS